jgi:hypothetical protein
MASSTMIAPRARATHAMVRATFLSSSSEGGGVRKNGFIIAPCSFPLDLHHPYHIPVCAPLPLPRVFRTSQNSVKRKSNFAEHALPDVDPISLYPVPEEENPKGRSERYFPANGPLFAPVGL